MKLSKNIFIILLVTIFISCNEDKILEEIPLDFYSPENSYVTPEHFEAATTELYNITRYAYFCGTPKYYCNHLAGTDFGRDARYPGNMSFGVYPTYLTSSSDHTYYWWKYLYEAISAANVILNRITDVEFPSEEEKNAVIAEARFFRGFIYRHLAFLYGAVPLELEEVTSPKRDYVRTPREEVYQQCIIDLTFASEHLPDINSVVAEGRVSKEAAFHYLAELYLATQQWDKAINAASQVIDNPNFQLMTERFGTRKSEPGDVWWDLFRRGNQNRSSGNTEAIWVAQMEHNVAGGGEDRYKYERYIVPLYWYIKDPEGVNGFIGPTSQNGGRGAGYMAPTTYWAITIWESDWDNDMRNSQYNMIRDFVFDNPASQYYGQKVSEVPDAKYDRKRDLFPFQTKVSTPGNHPEDMYANKETGLLQSSAGTTFNDPYYARLAETYLLRAEAYLGKGEKNNAADDINAVRERVNATPVDPANVDIDYILDERLRELAYEEKRRLTLSRLGMLYERTKKYNDYDDGETIEPYHELFPIPYNEIERNTGAVLEQNPGYDE